MISILRSRGWLEQMILVSTLDGKDLHLTLRVTGQLMFLSSVSLLATVPDCESYLTCITIANG